MPLSRFDKLDHAQKTRILAAAQGEFAERGYEQASLANVAAAAGISKATLYYYFADRDDLYATVVLRLLSSLEAADVLAGFAPKRAQEYWPALERVFRAGYELARKHPQELRALRSFNTSVRQHPRPVFEPIKELMASRLSVLVEAGQRLGCVRGDLELKLLVELLQALDDVLDREFFTRAANEDEAGFERQAARSLDLFRRLLEPAKAPRTRARSPLRAAEKSAKAKRKR
jgi:AcrR family transcriptional regulator